MRRTALRLYLSVMIGLIVFACTRDVSAPSTVQVGPGPASGHWNANGPDFIATLDLGDTVATATGIGTVKGTGALTGPGIAGGGTTFSVAGTDSIGVVHLIFNEKGSSSTSFTGQVADTVMSGILNGSGFYNLSLRFSPNPVVVTIAVTPQGDSVLAGRHAQFVAAAFDLLGRALPTPPVTWSTSDSTRGTISDSGLLTAIAAGSLQVTARSNAVSGQAQVKVLHPVSSVTVTPSSVVAVASAVLPFSAFVRDSAGNAVTGRAVTWTTTNASIVQVSTAGIVTTRAVGSADIHLTVNLDGIVGTSNVSVRTAQFTQVAAGGTHSCAVTADSLVACWGDGELGQLGNSVRTFDPVAAPVFIYGGRRLRNVQTGHGHSCGLAVDSSAYCWGLDAAGQLGDGTNLTDTVPVAVTGGFKFVDLVIGYDHTCGLVAGGTAYCWGSNLSGELGNGSSSDGESSPTAVSGGLSFTQLAAGNAHTCGITADGTAYCWGANDVGALGDSTTTSHYVPTPVAGGLKFAAIGAGALHTCAISVTGEAYCWGANLGGRLGDSSGAYQQNSPSAVHSAGVLFSSISGGYNHTCAVATTGQIYCWGDNSNGQVGPNGGAEVDVPVLVGLTGTSVATGGWHSCATTATGVYCWGYDFWGQLGAASSSGQSATPVRVSGQP